MSRAAPHSTDDVRTTIGYGLVAGAVTLAILLALKSTTREVDFCRSVFRGLVNGSPSVERKIDWEHLQAVGTDVGKEYRLFRLDSDRTNYRANFIGSFSRGFRLVGGSFGAFVKWRVAEKGPETVTVAADYPLKSKTLLFVIPASGEPKLLGLHWSDETGTTAAASAPAAPTPAADDGVCCQGEPKQPGGGSSS